MTIKPPLMRRDEIVTVGEAAYLTGRDPKFIRQVVDEFAIARRIRPGARLEISRPALEMVLAGDRETLEIFRAGDRSNPDVVRYFAFLGLPT